MELFKKKPLLILCFIFILFSGFAYFTALDTPFFIAALLLIAVSVLIVFIIKGRDNYRLILLFLSVLTAAIAVFSVHIRVDKKNEAALSFCGDRMVELVITDKSYSGDYYSTYKAKVITVGDNKVSFDTTVFFYFSTDVQVGDMVFAKTNILELDNKLMGISGNDLADSPEISVLCAIYEADDVLLLSDNYELNVFSRDWFYKKLYEIKNVFCGISDTFDRLFKESLGEDSGALASGILMGKRDGLRTDAVRDFRRVGLSHILAVSGLHISFLLGFFERVLSKILVPRKIRVIVIFFLSFILLGLADFALSAVRSVFMLWFFYFTFLFNEENDSLTSLFVSGALIILISPYSVSDVGFIMSFLATLGILSFYSVYENYINKKIYEEKSVGRTKKLLLTIVASIIITLVANFFILIVTYYFFGEYSILAVPANLIVSPLSTIFLVFLPLVLVFGKLPILGSAICFVTDLMGKVMFEVAEFLAGIPFASISLSYEFCGWIIVVSSLIAAVMLVVKIKYKWTFSLPIAGAVLAYCVCLLVFNAGKGQETIHFVRSYNDELVFASEKGKASIIDISGTGYQGLVATMNEARRYGATEIEKLIYTAYDNIDLSSVEYMTKANVIRTIIIPFPVERDEVSKAEDLLDVLYDTGTELLFYSDGDILFITESLPVRIDHDLEGAFSHLSFSQEGQIVVFADGHLLNSDSGASFVTDLSKVSDIIFIFGNGYKDSLAYPHIPLEIYSSTVIRSGKIDRKVSRSSDEYVVPVEEDLFIFTFPNNTK